MNVVHAPHAWDAAPTLFLAGSIEMGAASPWQDAVVAALAGWAGTILNPRRPDWDSSWRQSIDDPQFRAQVEWELDALERATHIAMYFDPATKAPITLCELGLHARSGRLVVACPDGFWRKGNVEVVCARYGAMLVDNWQSFVDAVRARA